MDPLDMAVSKLSAVLKVWGKEVQSIAENKGRLLDPILSTAVRNLAEAARDVIAEDEKATA